MAVKKSPNGIESERWQMSWRRLLILASFTLNVGFIVMVITMATTNAFDSMFIKEGLERYCTAANDDKFADSSAQVKAKRDYACARGDAKDYFVPGLENYLKSRGL